MGECKWGDHPAGRTVITELVEVKTPKVLAKQLRVQTTYSNSKL